MQVSNKQSNINFNAKYITKANIKHLVKNNYTDETANFVELEKSNIYDRLLIANISQKWDSFLTSVFYKYFKNNIIVDNDRFYAVTTQDIITLSKPEEDKVLGIVHLIRYSNNKFTINILQTNPKYIAKKERSFITILFDKIFHSFNKSAKNDREYRNIGKSIIDIIKYTFKAEKIELASLDESKGFYEKQGFIKVKNLFMNDYQWDKYMEDYITNTNQQRRFL